MAQTTTTQDLQELNVTRRRECGTRPTRRLRLQGVVPGVVYGKDVPPIAVSMPARALSKLLRSGRGEHPLVRLTAQEPPGWEQAVLVKEVQHDPVDETVLHVGFHAVRLTERIRVKVPVLLKGDAVGVKQDGGILEHFLREVEIECLPTEIPAHVEVDVGPLKIGDTLHVRDLASVPGVQMTTDPESVIASVLKPREEKPEEATAVTEPEVIREKKPQEADAAGEASASPKAPEPDKTSRGNG